MRKTLTFLLTLAILSCHSEELAGPAPSLNPPTDEGPAGPQADEGEDSGEGPFAGGPGRGPGSGGGRRRGPGGGLPEAPGGTDELDFYKGFNLVCWYRGCFEEEEIEDSLDALQAIGANWVAIVPTWYQERLDSNIVYQSLTRSPTLSEVRSVISRARARGLRVLLKPHIDVRTGGWRGEIRPSNLAAWQLSYRNFLLTFARLAQESGVEVLSIGTELASRSPDLPFWRFLIPEVRSVYGGLLTYSANWDEFDHVEFWDLLDFIGIDFYFPLSDSPDATREDLVGALESIGEDLEVFSDDVGLPFLFTEIGYRDVDGTITRPYDFNFNAPLDLEEQADAYAAVLTAYHDEPWLQGLFWWRWDPRITEDPENEGYLIYGSPAAEVLREAWAGAGSAVGPVGGTSPDGSGDVPAISPASVSFVTFGDWGDRGGEDQVAVSEAIGNYCQAHACQFVLTLGDNFYNDGVESVTDSHWQESYHSVYDHLGLPFYPSLGNHDMNGSPQAQVDYSAIDPLWRMPAQDYSFCWPQGSAACLVEIFVFNSNYEHFGEEEEPDTNGNGRNDYWDWMEGAVLSSQAPWKFLAMHHPLLNNGNHGDWGQGGEAYDFLTDLVCRGGIDLVLSGHAHSFSHLRDVVNGCPIEQVIVGTGGRGLSGVDTDDPRVLSTVSAFGFGWLQVTEGGLVFRFIRTDGSLYHEMMLP